MSNMGGWLACQSSEKNLRMAIETVEITDSSVITAIQNSLSKSGLGEAVAPYVPATKAMVHVAYRDDNNSLVCTPWNSWSTSRDDAEGVVVMEGTQRIMVAIDETNLYWGSKQGSGGATTTTSKNTADLDFDGKENTAAIVASAAFKDDGAGYAPGYCHAYSKGLIKAGGWWLPSMGQLGMIWKHFEAINAALDRIQGATKLTRTTYWSSTENSAASAWNLNMNNGNRWNFPKEQYQRRVRPVAAF